MTTLDDLLAPRSVAIVGASDDPARIGGRPLAYLLGKRFDGAVYPINPNRDTVQGLRAYPRLTDAPDGIDFVLIAVPAAQVADVVEQAIARRARTALIFSSGFAETGAAGAERQREVVARARAGGLRVIGPNCLGLFNAALRFCPTFTSTLDRAEPHPGGVAIASQSGAYGSHIHFVAQRRGLGVHYWVTTGNEADVSVAELIRLFAGRDEVQVILAYAESVKPEHGELLLDALRLARANRKPVVFMKVGRSEVGALAASSHTASLAGEDAVYDALLRQYGAVRAHSTEHMLDIACACRPRVFPAGRRLGVVTISGGAGVLMADAAERHGLEVAPMPDDAQRELQRILPFAALRNPVDVTAQFFNDLSLIPRFTEVMLGRGGYDGLIGFWTSVAGAPALSEPLLASLRRALDGYHDRPFLQVLVAPEAIRRRYEDAGLPCYEDPDRAVAAMAALMRFGRAFAQPPASPPPVPGLPPLPAGPLGERDARRLLAEAGLPVVADRLATDAAGAEAAVAALGADSRAVLKIASPDIAHKTEIGGVALGVSAATAAATYRKLRAAAARHAPAARVDGVLVSPQIDGGVECILGARRDPVFGPVVLFGLGGVFAEVLRDVAFRRAPFAEDVAREMIDELNGAALLRGARGAPAADLDALARAIATLSLFAAVHTETLDSVEMNPLLALPDRCVALDALIVRRAAAPP